MSAGHVFAHDDEKAEGLLRFIEPAGTLGENDVSHRRLALRRDSGRRRAADAFLAQHEVIDPDRPLDIGLVGLPAHIDAGEHRRNPR
jgi:chloramphenicol 3-O-phosphotransferase